MAKKNLTTNEANEIVESEAFQEKKAEQQISNAYFFGQFMMLHMILKYRDLMGMDALWAFIKKKYRDIGNTHQSFLIQAKKNDGQIAKYYTDSMETDFC
jgi:hypothetical protein